MQSSKVGNYWNSRKVVLLGGGSLIGLHLARALIDLGVKSLDVVDNFSSGNYDKAQELRKEGVDVWARDLRDYEGAGLSVYKKDIVFHLAAQHGGRGYVAGHAVELWNNLELDTTIFRACSAARVEKVVFSSSACAYPIELQQDTNELLYLSEDLIDYKRLLPADGAYGTEKLIGEAMLDSYVERGDFKGVSTRSFTVYGPLMKENHAIAALIAKTMIQQEPFEIWGNPDNLQVRNWTMVEDNVKGALLAAEHLDKGAINVGVEERLTPLDAAQCIWEYMGWYPKKVEWRPDKPVGPLNRVANSGRLFDLGWRPQYTFEEGLGKTIDWYLSTHTVEEVRKDFERKLTER